MIAGVSGRGGALRAAAVVLACGAALATSGAMAQGVCDSGKPLFEQRGKLVGQINAWSKSKVDPVAACAVFGKLQANGVAILAFMKPNKDWCHIPDEAVKAIEGQQSQIAKNKGQACTVAANVAKAKKQAQQQQAQGAEGGANNPFSGPDDLTGGARKIPQGAL